MGRDGTYLFRDSSDKSLVVRDDDNTSVPLAQREHQRIETLQIQVVSWLHHIVHIPSFSIGQPISV